ncbi:MAG: hypothetical protein R3281_04245 [Balneolaceae bacterium]|nr:hypothetical protein [Balneolaceae bacterium]
MHEQLEKLGRNPDSLEFAGLSEKGQWLVGEEAYERFLRDREMDSVKIETSKPLFNPEIPDNPEIIIQSGNPTPAETEFTVTNISNPPASGSITVDYEGDQVTTNYSSYMGASQVAYAISSEINNDPDIQITATVPSGSTVLLTEKRSGCEYNGNTVYVLHTNGTHISVNDTFIMDGGTDGVPCTPQLESPSNGANNVPVNLTLSWFSAAGASEYRVQLATDSGFSNLVTDESGLSSTYYSPPGLNNSTTYYWRVNASNNEGTSNWSNTWSFTTSAPTLFIDYGSSVNPPCCNNFGYVELSSYTWASEKISYLDVYGWSFRDYILLANLYDGGQDRSYAAVGVTEFKSAIDPQSFWEQMGDHAFQDSRLPNGSLNESSYDYTTY